MGHDSKGTAGLKRMNDQTIIWSGGWRRTRGGYTLDVDAVVISARFRRYRVLPEAVW